MTDRELMQMALDALNNFDKGNHGMRWQVPIIKALRSRLANEFNPDWNQVEALQESLREHMAEIQRLRAALAQPELEPVADMRLKIKLGSQYGSNICGQWFYLTPADDNASAALTAHTGITAPPQREENHDGEKFVYRAITRSGEIAHFGVYSAAKAWAKSGTVEEVPIRTFKVVQKPCSSCESLARTVMLDQTYHENIIAQREWQGLTDEEIVGIASLNQSNDFSFARAIEAKLKEKNT